MRRTETRMVTDVISKSIYEILCELTQESRVEVALPLAIKDWVRLKLKETQVQPGTTAFALIHQGQRIFGADNTGGWHIHPFAAPERHDLLADFVEQAGRFFLVRGFEVLVDNLLSRSTLQRGCPVYFLGF